jgi:hypothetical protein
MRDRTVEAVVRGIRRDPESWGEDGRALLDEMYKVLLKHPVHAKGDTLPRSLSHPNQRRRSQVHLPCSQGRWNRDERDVRASRDGQNRELMLGGHLSGRGLREWFTGRPLS